MEAENAFVLVNNPPPHPSGSKRVMSEIHVEVNKERSQAGQEERGQRAEEEDLMLLAT
jgi:hypothetical protein